MADNLGELLNIVLIGNKEESRNAARKVRKTLYSSSAHDSGDDINKIVETAPEKYATIKESWRQENFAVAISVLYFLHRHEKDPEFLFDWIFLLLQHELGNVRQAGRRMLEAELGPLTVHLRIPDWKSENDHIQPARAEYILNGIYHCLRLVGSHHYKPVYRKYKYVDSLPNGVYKTCEYILARLREDCGDEFFEKMREFDIEFWRNQREAN